MNYQLRYYKPLFENYVDFVALDAPYECKEIFDLTVHQMFKSPFYAWYFFKEATNECKGITETINYVVNFMNEHGPFDGVFAFSQGTVIARILLKVSEVSSTRVFKF